MADDVIREIVHFTAKSGKKYDVNTELREMAHISTATSWIVYMSMPWGSQTAWFCDVIRIAWQDIACDYSFTEMRYKRLNEMVVAFVGDVESGRLECGFKLVGGELGAYGVEYAVIENDVINPIVRQFEVLTRFDCGYEKIEMPRGRGAHLTIARDGVPKDAFDDLLRQKVTAVLMSIVRQCEYAMYPDQYRAKHSLKVKKSYARSGERATFTWGAGQVKNTVRKLISPAIGFLIGVIGTAGVSVAASLR